MLILTLSRWYRYMRRRRSVGVGLVLSLLLVSIFGNATAFYYFDGPLKGDDFTFGDALWYSVISITTIGYGDFYAESTGARWATVLFVVVLGLGVFSMLLGIAIDGATTFALREERGMGKAFASGHILIVNFPSVERVRALIDELRLEPGREQQEIVIVTDAIETMPFDGPDLLFVHGPVLNEATYQRASVHTAEMAIVLATNYEDPNSDAVTASAAAVIDRLRPEIHLVAECLESHHAMLFDTVNCDAIVNTLQISRNLLAQEVHDPGISQMVARLTSNQEGPLLYSCVAPAGAPEASYLELARQLIDRGANLLCVNRGDHSFTLFGDLRALPGDCVIYTATKRLSWDELNG